MAFGHPSTAVVQLVGNGVRARARARARASDAAMHPHKGKPDTGMLPVGVIHSQVTGISPQVSGSGVRHQVQVRARTRT